MTNLIDLMRIADPERVAELAEDQKLNLPFHISWEDKEGKIIGCNDTQAKSVGYEKGSDIFGCTNYDLYWRDFAPMLRQHNLSVMYHEKANVFIEPGFTRLGEESLVLSYKTPVKSKYNQQVIGIMGVCFWMKKKELFDKLFSDNSPQHVIIDEDGNKLTHRQIQCLYYLSQGLTDKEIAKKLTLSPKTIEHYILILREKFNARNRIDLAVKYIQLNFQPEAKS